jgi:hypothetical protein
MYGMYPPPTKARAFCVTCTPTQSNHWQEEPKILREEEEEEAEEVWTKAYENIPNHPHKNRHSIRQKHRKMRKMRKMSSKVSVQHTYYTEALWS